MGDRYYGRDPWGTGLPPAATGSHNFYHCALAGHADAIVTDNVADFPPVPGRKRPAILTPVAAVAQLWKTEAPSDRVSGRRPP